MSTASRLRQSIRDAALGIKKPSPSKRIPAPMLVPLKLADLNQPVATDQRHSYSGKRGQGGRIPGIPRHMRKAALAY